MKQNWEIKKLGEVATILNGYAFDSKLFSEDSNEMPLIRIRDIKRSYTETFYKGNFSEEYIIRKGDYLIGMDGEFNIAEWKGDDALLNQRVCKIIANEIVDRYLFWYMPVVLKQIEDATPFVTVKHLSSKQLLNTIIPIPPLAEQERIVAELDCLSGIIEKKCEQLKELDTLAQSIFYQMFGDPISNEKGWEVKRLKDVCSDIIDGDHNPPPKSDNGIPFITISNINKDTKTIELANTYYVTEDYYNSIKPNKKPKKGDVLYTVTGSYGLPVLIKEDIRFCFQRHIGLLRPTDIINSVYLYIWAMLPQTKYQADDIATGIAQKTISLSGLKQMSIILPPLTLQQEFANKIEAIEKQRELIKESIKETETLFNARMDYYFN